MAYFQGVKCRFGSLIRGVAVSRKLRQSYHSSTLQGESIGEACRRNSPGDALPVLVRRFSTEVTASQQTDLIRELREKTSAPIKDVKSCLFASNWDIEAAHKEPRKKGVVLATKKSSRMASEGLLALAQAGNKVAVIELNCETDFVARNEIFQYLASSLARTALSSEGAEQKTSAIVPFGADYLENKIISLDHPKLSGEMTVRSAITEVAAMVGENVKLRRGFTMSAASHGIVSSYLHTSPKPGLGRVAGLLSLEVENGNDSIESIQRIGSSLAMHIVAARPMFLSKELVSDEAMNTECEVLRSQAENTGKSQMAIEKMVEGRLRKYYEEAVLLEQKYVLNDSIKIKSLLDDLSKGVGSPVKIGCFLRVEVGEGIQRILKPVTMEANFFKFLRIVGVGIKAKAEAEGRKLFLKVGYSHDLELDVPPAVRVICLKNNIICCAGLHEQRVNQFASVVRSCKPPNIFTKAGIGIRYADEIIIHKEGKKNRKAH